MYNLERTTPGMNRGDLTVNTALAFGIVAVIALIVALFSGLSGIFVESTQMATVNLIASTAFIVCAFVSGGLFTIIQR